MRKITIYRDDSTTQVVFKNVKHIFWLANNSVFCIAQYDDPLMSTDHHYICWPRERFCWYRDEKDITQTPDSVKSPGKN